MTVVHYLLVTFLYVKFNRIFIFRCTDCQGEGEIINEKDRCGICKGKKMCNATKILEVHVDKGMRENQKILFRGEGDQQPDVEPGDVVIILQQKEHEVFQRSGDNLYMKHTIALTEALCGFRFTLRHLDGRELLVTHPPGQVESFNLFTVIKNNDYY